MTMPFPIFLAWHDLAFRRSLERRNASARAEARKAWRGDRSTERV